MKKPVSLIILCILSLLFSVTIGCVSDLYPGYFRSDFSYRLSIGTNEPITNVTFYVPLPVKNGQPMVGRRALSESDFAKNNFTASFTQSSPGLNLTGSYPVPGNSPWFVKLSTPRMLPDTRASPAYDILITDNGEISSPILFLNTLSPVGNESVFLPKLGFTPSLPTSRQSRTLDWLEYDNLMIPEMTLIFADYSAAPSAQILVGFSIEGNNGWKEPDDVSVGNSYGDYFQWSHKGESHFWQTTTGSLHEGGEGIYPNLTHPSWQKAIQRAQQGT